MLSPSIVIVDYHKGNLSSVVRGFARAGAEAYASDDPACVRAADGIVIPGVGSFYDAISYMSESGLDQAVLEAAGANKPILGICLGLQLLLDRGDEGVPEDASVAIANGACGKGLNPGVIFEADGRRWVRGLGLIQGSCSRLESARLKVPHVGWDQVHLTKEGADSPLLRGFPEGANMISPIRMRPTSMFLPRIRWAIRTIRAVLPAWCSVGAFLAASSIPRNPRRAACGLSRTSWASSRVP